MFNVGSATVQEGINPSERIVDGGTFEFEEGSYIVTAPTGVGGTVVTAFGLNGGGSFFLNAGDDMIHSWEITNGRGTATYTITVSSTL